MDTRPRHDPLLRLSAKKLFPGVGAHLHVNRPLHEGDIPLHDHDFVEIALVCAGRALHRTIHGERAVGAGDLFILHPGQWHAYERCRGLELINCCLGVELLSRELAWVRSDPQLGQLLPARLPAPGAAGPADQGVIALHLGGEAQAACRTSLESLLALQQGGDPVRARPEQVAYLLMLLGRIGRELGAQGAARSAQPGAGVVDPSVAKAMEMLEERLDHGWGLVELAKLLDLNRSYLVRLFKRHTGFSPMAWLARRRAEKAAVLLLTTAQPVAAVGRIVGWHDPNYFARRFRAAFGLSAREYRAQLPVPPLVRAADDWIQW